MSFDTPLVEYLIIGTHTSTWLTITLFKIFGVPIETLIQIEAATLLLALPLIYIIGMLFDDLVFQLLNGWKKSIQRRIIAEEKKDLYKDEFIALKAPELYSAYDARIRRVRIIGGAIFNWPLLGLSMCLYFEFNAFSILILGISILLAIACIYTWENLTRRALEYRKKACDVIRKENYAN